MRKTAYIMMGIFAFAMIGIVAEAERAGFSILLQVPNITSYVNNTYVNNSYASGGGGVPGDGIYIWNDTTMHLNTSKFTNCTAGQFLSGFNTCGSPSGSGNISGAGATGLAQWSGSGYIIQNTTDYYTAAQVGTLDTNTNTSAINYCIGIDIATNTTIKNWVIGQSYLTSYSETDPQVAVITANKWCIANSTGTGVNCTAESPGGDGATNTSYYLVTNPYGYYNDTTLPAGGDEIDPEWTGNYSLVYWMNNPYSFYNATTIPEYVTCGDISDCMSAYYNQSDVDVLIATENTTMRAFVIGVNTTATAYALGVTATANTTMKGYVDGKITTENTTMKAYVDGKITTENTTMAAYALGVATTANTTMKTYVDNKFIANSTNDWRVCFNATTCWSIQVNASGHLLAVDV